MKKTIALMKQQFESSTGNTPQFLDFARVFKKEFSAHLHAKHHAEGIRFSRGHFYISGFFKNPSGIWYFSIGDLRHKFMDGAMLLRRAKSFEDYTGGANNFISTKSTDRFSEDISRVLGT